MSINKLLLLMIFVKFISANGKYIYINPDEITAIIGTPNQDITKIDTTFNGTYKVRGNVMTVLRTLQEVKDTAAQQEKQSE